MLISEVFGAVVDWFLPPAYREAGADAERVRRAKLCVAYNVTVPLWAPGFVVLLWTFGETAIATIIAVGMVSTLVPLFAFRRTGSLVLMGNMLGAIGSFLILSCSWIEGGLSAPGILWVPVVPMIALLAAGLGAGVFWGLVNVAALAGFYVAYRLDVAPVFGLPADALSLLRCLLGASGVLAFLGIGLLFESLKAEALRSLETANRELARARDDAQAAVRAKSEFLATMSHEIRTPLHGIFGMTDLALDTDDDAERREFIGRARACGVSLMGIIDDILDFSRIEAGKLALEEVELDPAAVVDGVLDTLALAAAVKGIELVGWVDPSVPARLVGDPGRLRQILLNLAGNAVKFTEGGEVEIVLDGQLDPDKGGFCLRSRVRDTGIGIPPEKQKDIFEAFTQADGSTTRRYGGTGLGLAITQRLVGLMHGQVTLTSALGKGSTFGFTAHVGVAAAAATPVAAGVLTDLAVLVVDDAPVARDHLVRTLSRDGARVTAVASVGDALGLLAVTGRRAFDALVVDLGLPAVDVERLVRGCEPGTAVVGLLVPRPGAAGRTRPVAMEVTVAKPVKAGAIAEAVAAATARAVTRQSA